MGKEIEVKEEQEVKESKPKTHPFLIVLLVILMLAVGVFGGYLGVKYAKHEEAKKNTKEVKETQEKEKEKNKKNEVITLETNDPKVEKAYSLLRLNYEGLTVISELYSGKNLDLTKLSDEIKFDWTLYVLDRDITIPVCDPDATISVKDTKIKDYSMFEDVTFVNNIKSSVRFEYGSIGSYSYKYDEDHFILLNSNCDGYGPGASPFYLTEIDSATQKGNILTMTVKFAYYTFEDYRVDEDVFTYTAHETFSETGKVLKRGISDTDKLTDAYAKYQFTFKIVDEKVYPLTVKKV